jgi:hypothetical protein
MTSSNVAVTFREIFTRPTCKEKEIKKTEGVYFPTAPCKSQEHHNFLNSQSKATASPIQSPTG